MFPYTLESSTLFKKISFEHDQIQNPINDSPFFSNFPCPFFDEEPELPAFVFPPYSPPSDHHFTQTTINTSAPLQLPSISKGPPRKRTGKKDRHSKICTAQGVRDRRMRLSLQVARKFFDLQDMLGYDKASKTIEWLFCKSNKAIKDLKKAANPNPNTESECEDVVSGIEENEVVINGANPKNKKLARDLARERARCRTREKKMMMNKLGFINSIGQYTPAAAADEGTIEKLLQGNSRCVPTNNFLFRGVFGNWDDDQVLNNNDTRIVTNPLVKPAAGNSTSDFSFFHSHI